MPQLRVLVGCEFSGVVPRTPFPSVESQSLPYPHSLFNDSTCP